MNIYVVYTLLSQVIWGLLPLFWILLRGIPSLYVLATRIVWAAVLCYILILQKHLLPNLKSIREKRDEWPFIGAACILITINWGSFIYAMTNAEILQASLAYFINPIVVILFGSVIYKEKLLTVQKFSIAFAAAGLLLAFFIYGQVPYLAFLICLSWASYSLCKKRITLDSQVSVFVESFSMVPLALLFIAWSEWEGMGAVGVLSGWSWLLLPLTGIVTAVPMMLFTAGVKGTPITLSGIFMYLSPSITLVIAIATGEIVTTPLLITFIFAWIAIVFYLWGIWKRMHLIKETVNNRLEKNRG